MDLKFHPALRAIKTGDLGAFRDLLDQDPSLATAQSRCSHPTLLQALALEAVDRPDALEMGKLLIDGGADVDGALGAAACIDNVEIARLLLDHGAKVDGTDSWSPLEEALYWNNRRVIDLLLARGARIHNLRMAAALGDMELLKSLFDSDGSLRPEAGGIDWPFGEPKNSQWSNDRQDIINNAFVYASMHNQIDAATLLLDQGAQINAIPPGFDFSGTALHYAALNGHRTMVDFLINRGANPNIKDTKVNSTPGGWAEHGGHKELGQYLDGLTDS
jgi:uncharacterized protein